MQRHQGNFSCCFFPTGVECHLGLDDINLCIPRFHAGIAFITKKLIFQNITLFHNNAANTTRKAAVFELKTAAFLAYI